MNHHYRGQCACGAIEFGFDDEPMNTAFCYCKECQKHTGSDKWFGLWVALDKFKLTKGCPATFTRLGDSGKDMVHHFCDDCGTTVFVHVTVANFYSVAATSIVGENNFSPKILIYSRSAPDWAVFPVGIQKFDIVPPEMNQ